MKAIKCKAGNVFAACSGDFIDALWKLEEAYYKAQGCIVEDIEEVRFSGCTCEHCKTLEHEFENLIEDIKNEK
jgi:hypothetical protein